MRQQRAPGSPALPEAQFPGWGGCCLEPACSVLTLLAVLLLRGCLGAPKARQHTEGLLLYRERLFFFFFNPLCFVTFTPGKPLG